MFEALVVDQKEYKVYGQVIKTTVNKMCSTRISEHVTKNGGIVYFINNENVPDFLTDINKIFKENKPFKKPGQFINISANEVKCGLTVDTYSVLKEANSSYSLTLHEPDGSKFVIGFWTIDDYLKVKESK